MSARRRGERFSSSGISPEECRRIVVEGDAQLLTEKAETIGTSLARQLTTSQIRNVFGTVRQIEMNWGPRATEQQRRNATRQLILLKPKLAYQAKRERGRGVQELADVLIPAIDQVGDDRERFQNFMDFFEAILAYHTAAGGK
jgi:CRISPR-associated protein Csm2